MRKIIPILFVLLFFVSDIFAGYPIPEVSPPTTTGSSVTYLDDVQILWGTGSDAACEYDTAVTPDSLVCGVGTDSRIMYLVEKADINTDWARAQQTNPTLHIHSADATDTNDFIEISHNQTNGVIDVGTGVVSMPDGISTATISQSNLTTYTGGAAIAAGSYQCGRDIDATSQIHCNVPTGASFEFSVNDAAVMTVTGSNMSMNNQPIQNIGNSATDFGGGGQLTIGNAASAAGTTTLTLTNGAHTAITSVAPALNISSFTNTVNSGSTIGIGYAAVVNPPTYQGVAGGGAETVTDIYTMYLPGPGVVGSNLSNTAVGTLWVDSGDVRFDGNLQFDPQIVTVANNGAGTAAAFNITPGSGIIQITCNDVNGCDATMSETGAKNGVTVRMVNMSANAVNFADTGGVSETAGAFAAGQYDTIVMSYMSDRWVENSRSNN